MEKKTVVQGGHGPVPMEENGRRYIDATPVSVPMTGYYLRRMMSGELVEFMAEKKVENAAATAAFPMPSKGTGTIDVVPIVTTPPAKKEGT